MTDRRQRWQGDRGSMLAEVEFADVNACPACGLPGAHTIGPALYGVLPSFGSHAVTVSRRVTVKRCNACTLWYVTPIIAEAMQGLLYRWDDGTRWVHDAEWGEAPSAHPWGHFLESVLPSQGGSVLDV